MTDKILEYLPHGCADEIKRLLISRGVSGSEISEIRARAFGKSSVTISGERVTLTCRFDSSELSRSVLAMCDGALYAKRESIKDGYITLEGGVRVGVCGEGVGGQDCSWARDAFAGELCKVLCAHWK